MLTFLFSLRKLKCLIFLYLISFWSNSTFAYPLSTDYVLMQSCISNHTEFNVEELRNFTHEYSSHCHERVSSPDDVFENDFRIALKTLKIINEDDNPMVQISLTASLPSGQKNEGSFLSTFFWGNNDYCHKFIIPFSSLSSVKKTYVLPCIKLPMEIQPVQTFFVNSYYKETKESRYKITNIQASSYIVKEASKMQALKSVFGNFNLCSEQTSFHLTSYLDAEDICPSIYNISIIESDESQTCDPHGQKIVCQWVSTIKSSRLSLSCPRKSLKLSQIYCVHATLHAYEECKSTYLAATLQMSFLKVPFEVIPCNICKGWTASAVISTPDKKIDVLFKPHHEFDKCFYSYIFRLYIVKLDEKGTGVKNLTHEMRINHSHKPFLKSFTNVPQGNFSFLVIPCDKDYCHRNWSLESKIITTVKKLDSTDSDKSQDSTNSSKSQEFPLTVKIAMILPLLVISLSIFCCLIKKCRGSKYFGESRRLTSQNSIYHQVQTVESESTSQINSDKQMVYILHTLDQDTKRKVHILKNTINDYINYYNEINTNKLNVEIKTLVDLSFVDHFHDFFTWFLAITKCECNGRGPSCSSNYKFVIIVSDSTLRLLDNVSDTVSPEEEFLKVLKYIGRNRDRFATDCLHMFKVNFESYFNQDLNYVASRGYDLSNIYLTRNFLADLVRTSTIEHV